LTSKQLATQLGAAAVDHKGLDLRVLDLRSLSAFTDFFVLASGTSDRHVRTLAKAVAEAGRALGHRPFGVEGEERARWVLVDFGDVIVHLFQEEVREFYSLERLWGEAETVELPRGPQAERKVGISGRATGKAVPGG
jgi:ribosome-associated protein